MVNDPFDEEGVPFCVVPPGKLHEVGEGYFMIETKATKDGGFVMETGGEWLVLAQHVTSIFHIVTECVGCAVDSVSGEIKAKGA
jgi:hypothetical protein